MIPKQCNRQNKNILTSILFPVFCRHSFIDKTIRKLKYLYHLDLDLIIYYK